MNLIQDIQALRRETGAGIMECKRALMAADGDLNRAMESLFELGFRVVEQKADRVAADGIAYAAVFDRCAVLLELNAETDFVATNSDFSKGAQAIARTIAQRRPADRAALMDCTIADEDLTVGVYLQRMALSFRENIVLRRFEVLTGDMLYAYMHQQGKLGVILALQSEKMIPDDVWRNTAKELALQIASMSPLYVDREQISPAERGFIESEIEREIREDESLKSKSQPLLDRIIAGRIEKYYRSHCLTEQRYVKNDTIMVRDFLKAANAGLPAAMRVEGFRRFAKGEGLEDLQSETLDFAKKIAEGKA